MGKAIEDIIAERHRQIEVELWTAENSLGGSSMTTPKPVQAYAAVSPDGDIRVGTTNLKPWVPYDTKVGPQRVVIPVTIIPAEQYEAMVDYLERIIETDWHWAGGGKDEKIYGKHAKGARTILAALKEQDHDRR